MFTINDSYNRLEKNKKLKQSAFNLYQSMLEILVLDPETLSAELWLTARHQGLRLENKESQLWYHYNLDSKGAIVGFTNGTID